MFGAYRWTLQQILKIVESIEGRPAAVQHLTPATIRARIAHMATQSLALMTMRVRQSTVVGRASGW